MYAMNNFKTVVLLFSLGIFLFSCNNDDDADDTTPVTLDAGTLSGGPFTFTVDGVADMVSGISLADFDGNGDTQSYVITDAERNILGIPPSLDAVMGVDFDGAGEGDCYIYHLTYNEGLTGLAMGENLDDFSGDFDLSNFIMVSRNGLNAGALSGGPYDFVVDGLPDMVSMISLDDSELNGDMQTYVITDDAKNILGIPPTLEAVMGVDFDGAGTGSCYIYHLTYSTGLGGLEMGEEAVMGVDFDGAGTGSCYIYHLTYSTGLEGLEGGNNLDDLTGLHALSNFVTVNRNGLNAGTLSGGPFMFSVDGTADMVSGISLDDTNVTGSNQGYVITDADLNRNLDGFFALSNSISVYRNPNAGTISGGPFTFTVDGTPDMVSGITLDNSTSTGANGTWVITDDQNNILGLVNQCVLFNCP